MKLGMPANARISLKMLGTVAKDEKTWLPTATFDETRHFKHTRHGESENHKPVDLWRRGRGNT